MSKNKVKAEKYLATNAAKEVHATSDGFLFVNKQDAKTHAKSLKNQIVESFGKAAKEIEVDDTEDVSGMQKLAKEKVEAEKSATEKAAKEKAKKEAAEAKKKEADAKKAATAKAKKEKAEAEKASAEKAAKEKAEKEAADKVASEEGK